MMEQAQCDWIKTIFLAAIAGILCLPHSLMAQGNSILRVVVTSQEDGNPIAGAQVVLKEYTGSEGEKGEILNAGVTGSDGLQEFSELKAKTYRLEVTFVGYETHEEVLEIEQGERIVKQVALATDVEKLGEVVVEGEREVTTGEAGVEKISDVSVGRIPTAGTGGDLASYLQTLPGVVMSGDRGGSVHIRGGTPFQNKVLVDNLPISKPFHISNLFSAFPEQSINNVDLYAGGFGAEHMGTSSAIIDVKLNPGNMKNYEGNVASSPYLTSLQFEGPIEQNRQSFSIIARKSLIKETAPHIIGDEEQINFYDVMGRYSYQGDNYSCNFTGLRTFDRGQINPIRNLKLSWTNTVLGARCVGFAPEYDHPIELTAGYSGYSSSEGTSAQTDRTSGRRQIFAKIDHEQEVFGASIDYGFEINLSYWDASLQERFTEVESFSNSIPIFRFYSSTQWQPNDKVTLEPSIGSQTTLVTAPTFEPRLRVAYRPDGTGKQELSLAAGRYYQLFNGITDQRDAGTVFTVLKPTQNKEALQSALHGIAAYEQNIGNYLEANLEGYIKDYKNISVPRWTPYSTVNIETTLADGLAYGFDVRVEYDRYPFYFYIGYGYSDVEYSARSGSLGAWIEEEIFSYNPRHDQRHKLNAVGSFKFAGYTANVSWEYGSGKPFTKVYGFDLEVDVPRQNPLRDAGNRRVLFSEPYGERMPAYHRLDISLEKTFEVSERFSIDVQAGVLNIYNRENIFYYDVNTLSRINQIPRMPYISIGTEFNG